MCRSGRTAPQSHMPPLVGSAQPQECRRLPTTGDAVPSDGSLLVFSSIISLAYGTNRAGP